MNKILVVEDDVLLLGAIETLLKLSGFDVKTSVDAESAMGLMDSFRPDLVVCDLTLPGSSGFFLLHWIRSCPAYDRVAFIILTARTEQKIFRDAMGGGADDFLTKPVTSEDLLAAIKSRLARVPRDVVSTGILSQPKVDLSNSPAADSGEGVATNPWNLTRREQECLKWLIRGKTNEDVSKILGIAVGTLKRHNFSIFSKLGVESRTAAVVSVLTNPALVRLLNGLPDGASIPAEEEKV